MENDLREIAPPELVVDCAPVSGPRPRLFWAPVDRLVLPAYQRGITERAAIRNIERIATRFCWRRFGVLAVEEMPDGRFAVRDGQHRAAAARLRGDIPEVPVASFAHADTPTGAAAFVGLNRDRRGLSPQAIFWAEHAAGDGAATDICAAADAAGATILRSPKPAQACAPGETLAIGTLREIYAAKGKAGLRRALSVAVAAGCAPITSSHLKALKGALWDPELSGASDAALQRAIKDGWDAICDAADIAAMDSGEPRPRCLAVQLAKAARTDW